MPYRYASVCSADGTRIAYRAYGSGPGIVLVHGGAGAAQSFDRLATMLADEFAVFVPDRRGRGTSGAFRDDHSLATEAADLDALLAETGAQNLFGLSSGGVISLYAATRLPRIAKLALYEPPVIADGAQPDRFASPFSRRLDRGDTGGAMVEALVGTADRGSMFARVPRFVLRPLLRLMMRREKPAGDRIPIRELVPTLRQDIAMIRELQFADASKITAEVLLLGGSRSMHDLQVGTGALARTLPHAKRIVIDGVGHTAALDDDQPELVARELRRFFAGAGSANALTGD
ncbi:MAG TPA: alpha/beta hydrolase [Kofleriaceae bacterium]|jgi:pimeloyl-ACP methyl ester carboxylesterase|nr:alpha/beta hydrolase [Kofleriaceae bacterium]